MQPRVILSASDQALLSTIGTHSIGLQDASSTCEIGTDFALLLLLNPTHRFHLLFTPLSFARNLGSTANSLPHLYEARSREGGHDHKPYEPDVYPRLLPRKLAITFLFVLITLVRRIGYHAPKLAA